jgi:hypothetical protein
MDFVEGVQLSTFLKEHAKLNQAGLLLNLAVVKEVTLDTIYDQLADYILQISRFDFSSIGAISKKARDDEDDRLNLLEILQRELDRQESMGSGSLGAEEGKDTPVTGVFGKANTWSVTGRALTFKMNELATDTGYPADQFPNAPFTSASDYFHAIADQNMLHLQTQRNLSNPGDEANVRRRFIARRQFRQLIPKYCPEDEEDNNTVGGPFKLFCDDMQPSNMFIDPRTLRITALLNFEFTNSMPAQFTYDPPWWLLLRGPDMWLDHYGRMDEFIARYVPRMEQFLRALERAEDRAEAGKGGSVTAASATATVAVGGDVDNSHVRLSARMRESWRTGRFWFDYAARMSLDVDDIYWATLHDHDADGDGFESLDAATRAELQELVKLKMEQRRAYNEAYAVRFSVEGRA